MRWRYGNFLNERHGFNDHYYSQITEPPPEGVKWDPAEVPRLVGMAVPGLRVAYDRANVLAGGPLEVHGFVECINPFLSDGSMHVTVVVYDGDCNNVNCTAGHAGELECGDPECPSLPKLSPTTRYLADRAQTIAGRGSDLSIMDMTELYDIRKELEREFGPYPLGALSGKHSHRVVVRRRAVGMLTPTQLGRIEALLTVHPQLYLSEDEDRNRTVFQHLNLHKEPDRWAAVLAPSLGYNPPHDQHVISLPPPNPTAERAIQSDT